MSFNTQIFSPKLLSIFCCESSAAMRSTQREWMSVPPHCADWTPSSPACGIQIALACPPPWTPLFIRLPRMADTKSPLNLNLYETTTPTRTDLCRNTLLIIISRLSFYFNFAAPPPSFVGCRESALSCLRKAKIQ